MNDNIFEFPRQQSVEQVAAAQTDLFGYVTELEHENHQLRMTVADMAVDLYKCRKRLGEAS